MAQYKSVDEYVEIQLRNFSYLWEPPNPRGALRERKLPGRSVLTYSILELPTRSVIVIEVEELAEAVIERMLFHGVPIERWNEGQS